MVAEQLMIPKKFSDYPTGEFDVDLLIWDNKLVYGNVTDNWFPIPPYFLENGNNSPSLAPKDVQQELIDYCFKGMLVANIASRLGSLDFNWTQCCGHFVLFGVFFKKTETRFNAVSRRYQMRCCLLKGC
jgi:hypothetical protein